MRNVDKGIIKKKYNYGQKKIKRKSKMKKEKISQSLKNKCKKLKVRLTVKRGERRVYKSVKVLKKQCEKASKKGKRKFGAARRSGRVVPSRTHFGRPYFGYTVGGTVRFGSRRPEFHYPEHILKGYNTAKTCKKYRFGSRRPEFHYPEHILKGYNTAKDCKKYRFGQVKPLLDGYARSEAADEAVGNMFANPLGGFLPWSFLGTKAGNRTNAERIAFFMSSAEKKGKKKMSKVQAKKYLNIMDKIIQKKKISEKEKDFVVSFKLFSKKKLNRTIWCIKNPGKCGGIKFIIEIAGQVGLHVAALAFLFGGIALVSKVYDYFKGNNRRGNSPLVSDPLQDVPPPRSIRSRRRQRGQRERASYINTYIILRNSLRDTYNLGERNRNQPEQDNEIDFNEKIKAYFLRTGRTEEQINAMDQDQLGEYRRLFEETYAHGFNGEEWKHVNAINIMINGLRNGTITIENGSFRMPGTEQEQTVAVPVQSITPLFLDQLGNAEDLPMASEVQAIPVAPVSGPNVSGTNRLIGSDNEFLNTNAYGRRKRKVKRKKRKVKKRKVKKRKVTKRKGKKKK